MTERMKTPNEIAREYFSDMCELSYGDIGTLELYSLKNKLKEIDIDEPRYIISDNIELRLDESAGCIKEAYIFFGGRDWKGREAIYFNKDGFIGFCGWADSDNTQPIIEKFIEWCSWLQNRKLKRERKR